MVSTHTCSLRLAGFLVSAALACSSGAGAASAGDLTGLVAPYLRARDEGALGLVEGKAYAEAKRPAETPTPYVSVSVLLVPYSEQFAGQLDEIKAHSRDSLKIYGEAADRLEDLRVDYTRALLDGGAGDLVRNETTDSTGAIRLAAVPAGEWLLLAWMEQAQGTKEYRVPPKEAQRYRDKPLSVAYSVVSYWRARLTVTAGQTSEVTLSDRSVWMTTMRQETRTPDRAAPRSPGRR